LASEALIDDKVAVERGIENHGYRCSETSPLVKEACEPSKPTDGSSSIVKQLNRTMGYRQGFALMVGLILGSGIFLSPGLVAHNSTSNGMILVIWVGAGCLAMMGSLCYCELASIFKMTGSNYVNVLKIYGSVPGFLCAWTTCFVIDPSSIAAIGLTVGLYLAKPFYPSDEAAEPMSKVLAVVVILIAFTVNCISVKCSSRVQTVFVVAQLSSVTFVIVLGVWQLSKGEVHNFQHMFTTNTTVDTGSIINIGIALFGALWSYDGWSQMSNAIEEMENMERNLLLTIMTAFPFVIMCYTLVNVALLSLLDRKGMAASKAVGVEFVKLALGPKASYAMMTMVGLSAYGTLNGTLFACPRLTLAAAREGHMPTFFSFIHKKTLSPMPATFLTASIALMMLVPKASDLEKLILLFSQAQWMLYSASIFGVIVMRIRQPNIHRPFKVFIAIPIVMFLIALTLVIVPFFQRPYFSLGLLGFILLGIPVYFIFVYHHLSLPDWFIGAIDGISEKLQKHCGMVPCNKMKYGSVQE